MCLVHVYQSVSCEVGEKLRKLPSEALVAVRAYEGLTYTAPVMPYAADRVPGLQACLFFGVGYLCWVC